MNNLKRHFLLLCFLVSIQSFATEVKLLDTIPKGPLPIALVAINKSYCIVNEPVNLVLDIVVDGYLSTNPEISYPEIKGGEILQNLPDSFSYSIKDDDQSASVKRIELKFYGKKEGVIVIPKIKIQFKYRDFNGKRQTKSITTDAKIVLCHLPTLLKNQKDYLVADSVKMTERWVKCENIDHGSVLTQHITIKATGQLARFIPTPYLISDKQVDVIAYEPKLTNSLERGELKSEATFVYDYTITGRGKIVLQTEPLTWWNPKNSGVNYITFQQEEVHIQLSTAVKIFMTLVLIGGIVCFVNLIQFHNNRFITKAKRALKKRDHRNLQNLVYERLQVVGILIKSELKIPHLNQFLDSAYLENKSSMDQNRKTRRAIKRELVLLARVKKRPAL